jgi:serine/threonine protein kinase
LDLGDEQGHPYIVMELLKGSTLNKALKEPALEPLEAKLSLMIQACEGLSRAHTAGVVHRDIKPSNLFVLSDGTLKILDFGVARLANARVTSAGVVVGTPDYMSPEQARGEDVDERSDVFSVAAVFYFMVTGRKPFESSDVHSTLRNVINEDPAPITPQEAPAPLARVIFKAMRKAVSHRYQHCTELGADLGKVQRHFQAQTQSLAFGLHAEFQRLRSLADGVQRLRVQIGLDPSPAVAAVAAALPQRFPELCGSMDEAPVSESLSRRHQLKAVADELHQFRARLNVVLEDIALRDVRPPTPAPDPPAGVLAAVAPDDDPTLADPETGKQAGGLLARWRHRDERP